MKPSSATLGCLLFLFVIAVSPAQDVRHVINSAHTGPVRALRTAGSDRLLYSGGQDGTVRVWLEEERKLLRVVQISHLPILMLDVNPAMRHVAAVSSDGLNTHLLTVWDWESDEEVYSLPLAQVPLDMGYSPQGTYLIFAKAEFKSLTVLQASSGRPLPYLTRGAGIVSSFVVGESERTIMTYSPSGTIRYYDIREGTERQSVRAASDIGAVSYSGDRRYMAGSRGGNLVYVDLVTGQTVASLPLPGIAATSIQPDTGEIVVLTTASSDGTRTPALSAYGFAGSNLRQRNLFLKIASPETNTLLARDGSVYTADREGRIYVQSPSDYRPAVFSSNILLSIDDIAAGDEIILTNRSSVMSVSSDFLYSTDPEAVPEYVEFEIAENPLGTATGIAPRSSDEFLLYTKSGDYGAYVRFTPSQSLSTGMSKTTSSQYLGLEVSGDRLLTLDTGGEIRTTDIVTGEILFTYTSFGLRTTKFADSDTIIAGSNRSARWNSTLLQLNPNTGETVPIADTNVVTYDLSYDPVTRQLYTMGIEEIQGKLRTVLKAHYGRSFDRSRSLLSVLGEDLDASMVVGKDGTVYTSLGNRGVRSIQWGEALEFEDDGKLRRRLDLNRDWLIALNFDNSLTVWDTVSRKRILDFYVFADLTWAVVTSAGGYYTSSTVTDRILFYRGNDLIERVPDSFQETEPDPPIVDPYFMYGF